MHSLHCRVVMLLQVNAELAGPALDVDTLAAAGKWMPAHSMVQMLTQAQQQSQADWQNPALPLLSAARSVHDAVLSAAVITHLPPSRLSCLRTMLAPDSRASCTHPDCKQADCLGNRLSIVSTAPPKMHINFPHHKNARRWKRAVIEFDVPSDLAELLLLYLEGPRKLLLQHTLLAEETCDTVFMDSSCRTFGSSSLCTYWQSWMRSLGGPPLTPSICRKIFVTERCSDNPAPGPSDRGAAMVMGHSTRQWLDWYDVKFHAKLAQHAVDAMKAWRHAMLQGGGDQSAAAATDAAVTSAAITHAAVTDAAVTQDALANAAVVDATVTGVAAAADTHTAVASSDEGSDAADTDADLNPAAKRRRFVLCSDSESDSQPEPANQQPASQALQLPAAVQQPASQAEHSAQRAEVESNMSGFLSCSSGGDSDLEVDLELL